MIRLVAVCSDSNNSNNMFNNDDNSSSNSNSNNSTSTSTSTSNCSMGNWELTCEAMLLPSVFMVLLFRLGRVCLIQTDFPAWRSQGRRTLIAGWRTLERLAMEHTCNPTLWGSDLRPPGSENPTPYPEGRGCQRSVSL